MLRTRTRQRLLIGATACAALAGPVACDGGRAGVDDAALRSLVRETRFGPRFSVGIGCADGTGGAGGANPCALDPRRLDLVARLQERADQGGDPDVQARLGVALSVAGAPRDGIRWLQRATDANPASWRAWNDLAAACLIAASLDAGGDVETAVRALDAASRAVALQGTPEAATNLALSAARIGLPEARDAWQRLLDLETAGVWAEGARAYLKTRATDDAAWTGARAALERMERPGPDLARLVSGHPSVARDYLDESLLPRWARAALAGGADEPALRALAQDVATSLSARSGDALPRATALLIARGAPAGSGRRLRLIATGHRAFGLARQHHEDDEVGLARVEYRLAREALAAAGSPFQAWPAVYEALLAYDDRDLPAALGILRPLIDSSRAAGHLALEARGLWVRGLVRLQQSDPVGALDDFLSALILYERLHDDEGVAATENLLADTYRTLGDERAGWRHLARALARLGHVRRPIRRYVILLNASLFAARSRWLDAALVFQNASIAAGQVRGPGPVIEGLARRALLLARKGEPALAEQDVRHARQLLTGVRDASSVRYFTAELRTAEGVALRGTRPADAVRLLRDAVALTAAVEPSEVPSAYLELARAAGAAGLASDAELYLADGIRAFEAQRSRVSRGDLRAAHVDAAWDLYLEGVQQRLQRGAPDLALAFAERGRARVLLEDLGGPAGPASDGRPAGALPRTTVVLVFLSSARHLDAWAVRSTGTVHRRLAVGSDTLQRAVDDLLAQLSRGSAVDDVATRLHRAVLSPLRDLTAGATTLVVVPDGPLHFLPIAALRDPATGRLVVEDAAVVTAPSVATFLSASRRASARGTGAQSALIVGNPAIDRRRFPDLAPLPAAEREAAAISGMYRNATVLTGPSATRQAFLDALDGAQVVHVGAHALANDESPHLSSLLLAPSPGPGDAGVVFARDIAGRRLARTRVVVLAACETGRGRRYRGEGVASLARPFLQASVPTVIATLWAVEDRATQEVAVAYHRHLAAGRDPADALRRTQLERLRAGASGSTDMTWAAFTAVGGTDLTAN
jgi:CHAT domain-containing protein